MRGCFTRFILHRSYVYVFCLQRLRKVDWEGIWESRAAALRQDYTRTNKWHRCHKLSRWPAATRAIPDPGSALLTALCLDEVPQVPHSYARSSVLHWNPETRFSPLNIPRNSMWRYISIPRTYLPTDCSYSRPSDFRISLWERIIFLVHNSLTHDARDPV